MHTIHHNPFILLNWFNIKTCFHIHFPFLNTLYLFILHYNKVLWRIFIYYIAVTSE
nr:MAG TPA: hypothetical protein [Caudoviricetes sp.]